jgi:hypothetical protein
MMFKPAPIPSSPGEITSHWLSSVLATPGAPVAIDSVQIVAIGTGQTGATYRVTPTYATGGKNLPSTFVVKLPSQDVEVRERVALGYRSEYCFYTEVVETVCVPTPYCHYVEIARDGAEFVLLLSDLFPAVQGSQIEGCHATEAGLAVEALAGLHGPRWCDPRWAEFAGTVMPLPNVASAEGMGDIVVLAVNLVLERLSERICTQDQVTLRRSAEVMADWLLCAPDRFSLLHGDFRLDNLLFAPDFSAVTVVDWQTLAVGLPARDLAYFIGTSLKPDARGEMERSLVAQYHSALTGYGVDGYDLEQCWYDYRLGMLQIPLIATLGFAFSSSTDRGDDMTLTMLQRGCRAIRELETLELVGRRR